MNTSLENNLNLTFINLKAFLIDYFIKHEFIFICDNPDSVVVNGDFKRNTVHLTDISIEQNLRFSDSSYPDYLHTFLTYSKQYPLRETIRIVELHITYPYYLFRIKFLQLFQIILYRDFYCDKWWDKWIMDKCYVVKQNGNLEYYTIYDFPKLLENLLDWVTITCEVVNINGKKGRKLILDFNL